MKKVCLALAFVLLAPMLLVSVSSSATYDAWSDLDADGDVDIFDVVKVAGAYSTTGDPTKDVTVTNWEPTYQAQPQYQNVSWDYFSRYVLLGVNCGGFSKMYVYATVNSAFFGVYSVRVTMSQIQWVPGTPGLPVYYENKPGYMDFTAEINGEGVYVPQQIVDDSHAITVKASQCLLWFYIETTLSEGWIELYITPYLRNE